MNRRQINNYVDQKIHNSQYETDEARTVHYSRCSTAKVRCENGHKPSCRNFKRHRCAAVTGALSTPTAEPPKKRGYTEAHRMRGELWEPSEPDRFKPKRKKRRKAAAPKKEKSGGLLHKLFGR